jgi:hypothetical protein
MCRNIKPLYNFDPPVSHDDIRNASLQFVRKVSGMNNPRPRRRSGKTSGENGKALSANDKGA